jgi:hypothetical protein
MRASKVLLSLSKMFIRLLAKTTRTRYEMFVAKRSENK